MSDDRRRDELATRLADVRGRIEATAAGRPVTLVVVTKTWPASDIRLLHELGVTDIGENRHQEAAEKVAVLGDLDLRWHFVGQVQSNKAAAIAGYADLVHSVDSARVVRRLDSGASRNGRIVGCLVQVSLDPPTASGGRGERGGVAPAEVRELADMIGDAESLRLAGVMGVAPLGLDPRPAFGRLVDVSTSLQHQHPDARVISAGMTEDFEVAISAGATHVRVGSAVLGSRPPLR